MKIRRLFFISVFILSSFSLYAKDNMVPMIKTPFAIKGTTWNKDGTTFAYAEGNNIVVRNSEEYTPLQTIITHNGEIQFMQFTQSTSGEGLNQLATLSNQHILDIRILPYEEPINTVMLDSMQKPSALAYSYNGNYIATGTENGYIYLFFQNYLSGTMTCRNLGKVPGSVKSLNFSRDNKVILAADNTGTIKIWNVINGEELYQYEYYFFSGVNVLLSHNSQFIVAATGPKSIGLYNIEYELLNEIETEVDILAVDFTADGDKIIILTQDNHFTFYDAETLQATGYIPEYNANPVSSYSFNNTTTKLLVGHTDGSIYVLNIEDVMLAPGEVPPSYFMIAADDPEALKKLLGITDDTIVQVEESEKEDIQMIRRKEEDSVDVGLQLTSMPSPYALGLNIFGTYKNYTLIPPFYFGGGIAPEIAFPKKDFPFVYENSSGALQNPLLAGIKVDAPFGIYVYPFTGNIPLFAEVSVGLNLFTLWNCKFGGEMYALIPKVSFCGNLRVGFDVKQIKIALQASYDTILKFSCGIYASFSINLPKIVSEEEVFDKKD